MQVEPLAGERLLRERDTAKFRDRTNDTSLRRHHLFPDKALRIHSIYP
jgi:hypothetical protein